MQLSYRGSVNRWECDENDHLNVRYFLEKHWQTLTGGLAAAGVTCENLSAFIQFQHIRFLRECRIAAPLSGYWGVVAAGDGWVEVLTELRSGLQEEACCCCIHRILEPAVAAGLQTVTDELPAHAAPRGVEAADLAYARLPLGEVAEYGFQPIGMGVIQAAEVEADGMMCMHHYMGRLSDSMPHLWGTLHDGEQRLLQGEGGAVLEYRLRFYQPLRLQDRFSIHSGLAAGGPKLQQFAHLVFNPDNGRLCYTAAAVGVRMDLAARKAVVLSAQRQAHMRSLQLKPL